MIISGIQEYENSILNYQGSVNKGDEVAGANGHVQSSNDAVLNLQSGQVVTGQVVDVQDNTVQLLLDDNQTISARLENGINVTPGQMLSFEVTSNGSQTALRALYANMNASSSVLNALSAAGMPSTDRNITMVQSMMEQGMSVNRNALYSMLKDVNAFPNADPATIVQLNKLSLPINEININQFENYKNFEYQIIDDANDLSDSLANLFSEGIISKDGGIDIAKDILGLIPEGNINWEEEIASLVDQTKDQNDDTALSLEDKLKALMQNISEEENAINEPAEESHGKISEKLLDSLKELGLPEDKAELYSEGKIENKDIIDFVKYVISNNSDSNSEAYNGKQELLDKLFGEDEFKSIVKNELMNNWTLKPEEVADNNKVQELYKRLNEQSIKAMEILENAGKESTPAMKSAQNINENVDFMNQLNQMMAYVQLPLKMAQQNAHGDLYVYTRKKNLLAKDGNVSALLHLDMDNLGPMDVYVAMQNNKVNTHFYMQDVATLDFIEANIHLLDERLTKKGYDMHTSVTTKADSKKENSIVDEFLANASDEGTVAPMISKLSFDVRA